MRYFLIDRIEQLTIGREIRAVKSVSLSEDIFSDHFFGYPVMPGALLIESLAQAGTALLEYSNNFKFKAILVMVDQAKFRIIVKPGTLLDIHVKILSQDNASARLDGEILNGRQVVTSARITFTLHKADTFYREKVRHLMESLYDTWLRDAVIIPEGGTE